MESGEGLVVEAGGLGFRHGVVRLVADVLTSFGSDSRVVVVVSALIVYLFEE